MGVVLLLKYPTHLNSIVKELHFLVQMNFTVNILTNCLTMLLNLLLCNLKKRNLLALVLPPEKVRVQPCTRLPEWQYELLFFSPEVPGIHPGLADLPCLKNLRCPFDPADRGGLVFPAHTAAGTWVKQAGGGAFSEIRPITGWCSSRWCQFVASTPVALH